MIGRKFKVTKIKFAWHTPFHGRVYTICEGYDPEHHQYPTMTSAGRTWFDKDCVELLPE